jgi:hypothetical protein
MPLMRAHEEINIAHDEILEVLGESPRNKEKG